MKKLGFILSFALVYMAASSQEKKIKLLEDNFGPIQFQYSKYIDLEKADTSYLVYVGFKNAKYSYITDYEAIGFDDSLSLNEFITDLTNAYKQIETGERVNMSWIRKNYRLFLVDYARDVRLEDGRGSAYTWIHKKHHSKLISILSRIKIGSDQIKEKE